MNIKETFIKLTSRTYPHGTEYDLLHLLPKELKRDEFDNLYIKISDEPSTMFTSHLDTASHELKNVNHIIDENIIRTDGTSILGADNKAGVTIMLYMILHNIPGLYYFFLGEERGCIGSKKVALKHKESPDKNIKKVISFDRRGNNSVITYQSSQRCCSNTFGNSLVDELNKKSQQEETIPISFSYNLDPTGIYTDSYQFINIYPECTNISVGYQNEHTHRESQDILHLEKLAKTCVLINWEGLPTERNPSVVEWDEPYGYRGDYTSTKEDYLWNSESNTKKLTTKKIWFIDNDYNNHISYIEIDELQKPVGGDLSSKRIDAEKEYIKTQIKELEVPFKNLHWNGIRLELQAQDDRMVRYHRYELEQIFDELNFWRIYIK